MNKVESFSLDHTKVKAPYLRLCEHIKGPNGDVVSKFDIRFCQPNVELLEMKSVHTFEHLFATSIRGEIDGVIDFSPMGCRTGFYLTIFNAYTEEQLLPVLLKVFTKIETWSEPIPATTPEECGSYKEHNLEGARAMAKRWLYGVTTKGWQF